MTKQTGCFLKRKLEEKAKVRLGRQSFALVAIEGDFCGLADRLEDFKVKGTEPKDQVVVVEPEPRVWIHYTQLVIEGK